MSSAVEITPPPAQLCETTLYRVASSAPPSAAGTCESTAQALGDVPWPRASVESSTISRREKAFKYDRGIPDPA
jgi:hypothetical protein